MFETLLLAILMITSAKTFSCDLPNVGTVLFRKNELRNINCWNREAIALLYSRRIFQELLPRKIPNKVLLHDYIVLSIHGISDVTISDYTFSMMVIALADVFGGFLQAYGLPILNEAFYEGVVDYLTAKKLYNVQDDFKSWLKTNGGSWARRVPMKKHITKIIPLKIDTIYDKNICSKLIMNNDAPPSETLENKNNSSGVNIPLPVLDNYQQPSAIAVPFSDRTLYNLEDQSSFDIIVNYYSISSQCIMELNKRDSEIDELVFDRMFYDWLKKFVLPHLKDNKLYVGFSSVLRVEKTIKENLGSDQTEHNTEKLDLVKSDVEVEKEAEFILFVDIIAIFVLMISICLLVLVYRSSCNGCCSKIDLESYNCFDQPSTSDSDRTMSTGNWGTYTSENPVEWTRKYKKQFYTKLDSSRTRANQSSTAPSSKLSKHITFTSDKKQNGEIFNKPVKGCKNKR